MLGGRKLMTPDEAKIILLEDELQQAINQIEFLHNCLTSPGHNKYEYPEMTLSDLERFKKWVPEDACPACIHAHWEHDNCPSCVATRTRWALRQEAKKVLGLPTAPGVW